MLVRLALVVFAVDYQFHIFWYCLTCVLVSTHLILNHQKPLFYSFFCFHCGMYFFQTCYCILCRCVYSFSIKERITDQTIVLLEFVQFRLWGELFRLLDACTNVHV